MQLQEISYNTDISIQEAEKISAYARAAKSESTKRAYLADVKRFMSWCEDKGLESLPAQPETVVRFIVDMADDLKITTLSRYLSSINVVHRSHGYPRPARMGEPPLVDVWQGIVRTKGRTKDKKHPLLIEDIRLIIDSLPDGIKGVRDKALILWGFATASRRSELFQALAGHVTYSAEGAKFFIPRSKRDQEGIGFTKGVLFGENPKTCPVRALKNWTGSAGIESGHLFRAIDRHGNIKAAGINGRSINRIIKESCTLAGLNADLYGAHSLRSGFCTQAARVGIPELQIMRHTGHKSASAVRDYIIQGEVFSESPTGSIGL